MDDPRLLVVRGEQPWTILPGVTREGAAWRFAPATDRPAIATAEDLEIGLMKLRERPGDLSEWASFLLAYGSVEFSWSEDSPFHDAVVNGLWDLAFRDTSSAGALLHTIRSARLKG